MRLSFLCIFSDTQHVLYRDNDGDSAAELRGVQEGHPVTFWGTIMEFSPWRGL